MILYHERYHERNCNAYNAITGIVCVSASYMQSVTSSLSKGIYALVSAAAAAFFFDFLDSRRGLPMSDLSSSSLIDLDDETLSLEVSSSDSDRDESAYAEYQAGLGERRRGPAGRRATG
jgi:hypothetical protein